MDEALLPHQVKVEVEVRSFLLAQREVQLEDVKGRPLSPHIDDWPVLQCFLKSFIFRQGRVHLLRPVSPPPPLFFERHLMPPHVKPHVVSFAITRTALMEQRPQDRELETGLLVRRNECLGFTRSEWMRFLWDFLALAFMLTSFVLYATIENTIFNVVSFWCAALSFYLNLKVSGRIDSSLPQRTAHWAFPMILFYLVSVSTMIVTWYLGFVLVFQVLEIVALALNTALLLYLKRSTANPPR